MEREEGRRREREGEGREGGEEGARSHTQCTSHSLSTFPAFTLTFLWVTSHTLTLHMHPQTLTPSHPHTLTKVYFRELWSLGDGSVAIESVKNLLLGLCHAVGVQQLDGNFLTALSLNHTLH